MTNIVATSKHEESTLAAKLSSSSIVKTKRRETNNHTSRNWNKAHDRNYNNEKRLVIVSSLKLTSFCDISIFLSQIIIAVFLILNASSVESLTTTARPLPVSSGNTNSNPVMSSMSVGKSLCYSYRSNVNRSSLFVSFEGASRRRRSQLCCVTSHPPQRKWCCKTRSTSSAAALEQRPCIPHPFCGANRLFSASSNTEEKQLGQHQHEHTVYGSGDCVQIFSAELPEGYCVGISLCEPKSHPTSFPDNIASDSTHWLHQYLHRDEISYGCQLNDSVRNTFFLGRLAIRNALYHTIFSNQATVAPEQLSSSFCPTFSQRESVGEMKRVSILKDEHGRPDLPEGFLGSISHKQNVGVALVAFDEDRAKDLDITPFTRTKGIGVDIEKSEPRPSRIARRVLTPREIESLGKLQASVWNSLTQSSTQRSVFELSDYSCSWFFTRPFTPQGITRDEEVLLRFR